MFINFHKIPGFFNYHILKFLISNYKYKLPCKIILYSREVRTVNI